MQKRLEKLISLKSQNSKTKGVPGKVDVPKKLTSSNVTHFGREGNIYLFLKAQGHVGAFHKFKSRTS